MAPFNGATQQARVRALNMCSERFRLGGPLGGYTPTALSRGSGWRAMTSFWYEALVLYHEDIESDTWYLRCHSGRPLCATSKSPRRQATIWTTFHAVRANPRDASQCFRGASPLGVESLTPAKNKLTTA